jgi:hypothetical protein
MAEKLHEQQYELRRTNRHNGVNVKLAFVTLIVIIKRIHVQVSEFLKLVVL